MATFAPGVAGLWLFLNAGFFVYTTRAGKFAVWAESPRSSRRTGEGPGPAIFFGGGKSGRLPRLPSTRRELLGGLATRPAGGGVHDRTGHGLRRIASIFS
jgi:hypothetical protein